MDTEKPFRERFRAVPYALRPQFKELIYTMRSAGLIEDSKSPYSSPTNLVKKPDGTIRMTQDFKKLNSHTIKDSYPLPIINDLFYNLLGANYFSNWISIQAITN